MLAFYFLVLKVLGMSRKCSETLEKLFSLGKAKDRFDGPKISKKIKKVPAPRREERACRNSQRGPKSESQNFPKPDIGGEADCAALFANFTLAIGERCSTKRERWAYG